MQPLNDLPDRTKKRKFKKMKQMITEKLQNINDEEVSDSEQVDLSIELHPIKHYIDDKEEMIEQMFTSLGPTLIQNMLPPLLKPVPLNELKADCLIQLLGMSKKRIFTSIDGKELQSSSDSDIDSEDSSGSEMKSVKSLGKRQGPSKVAKRKYIIDADTLNVSIDDEEDLENLSLCDGERTKAKKRKSSEKTKKSKQKYPKLINGAGEVAGASPISISSNDESDLEVVVKKEAPKKGQTLLEILELEMRAKAIRSLLKQGPSSSPQLESDGTNRTNSESLFDPNIKIKNEPREPDPDPDIIEIIEPPPPEPIVVDSDDATDKPESEIPKNISAADKPETQTTEPSSSEDAAKSVSAPAPDNAEKNEPKGPGTSWSERYLENKETEKLIKTSKMCTNIRKRMRLVRSMQMQQVKEKVEIPVVIGSISEYQQLIGNDNSNNSAKETTETEAAETAGVQTEPSSNAVPVNASTQLPVSNPLKATDFVCSDILEIDVSIADLDSDSRSEAVPIVHSVREDKRPEDNQNNESNSPKTNQSDEDRPVIIQDDEDSRPEINRNDEDSTPEINRNDEDSRPEINRNDEDSRPEINRNDEHSTPEINRNDEDSRPEINRNDEDSTPEINRNDEDSTPEINRNDEDSTPEINRKDEDSTPEINKNDNDSRDNGNYETSPKDDSNRPEVSQNNKSNSPTSGENNQDTAPEVNHDDKEVRQNNTEVNVVTETNNETVTEADDDKEEGEIDADDTEDEAPEKSAVSEDTSEIMIHIDLTDD